MSRPRPIVIEKHLPKLDLRIAAIAALISVTMPFAAFAEHGGHNPAGAVVKLLGLIRGQSREIDERAMEVYETTPRPGSCAERRQEFLAILPDALHFSRYARDIYERDESSAMAAAGLATKDLGGGRTAYYEAAGQRYAEVRVEPERNQAVIIFRGTRPSVGSDVSTDVLSFIGIETAYYDWASGLAAQVVRDHPGMQIIATGQSLGGGLSLYAVLRNPGVKGFAFNPAGLSLLTWAATPASDRARTNADITVISTRNAGHIEPVTAISLAGRSVLPGHIFVLEADAFGPLALHSAKTIVTALERASATGERGICDANLGVLAD